MTEEFSRRDFISLGVSRLVDGALSKLQDTLRPATERKFLRPPGAQVEALFLTLCTKCDACTAACPHEAISVHYGSGDPYDGTPVLSNLQAHPCMLCEDTPCIPVCPTEALVKVERIEDIKIGVAILDTMTCTGFRGSGCALCYDVCPLKDTAIELKEGLPFVLPEGCTGCGICSHHCPVRTESEPAAIQVFPC